MKISLDDQFPIETFSYLETGPGSTPNGKPPILQKDLPIYLGSFEKEEVEVDFLIICSDLQGMVEKEGELILLGEELPEFLHFLLSIQLVASEEAKIGVLLCGDLYTNPEKRGGSGDVRGVWHSFNQYFDWVIGVAGNHDRFGTKEEQAAFEATENLFLLHHSSIAQHGLSIGGISGIIGRSSKPNRVEEKHFLKSLKSLLKQEHDLILLHEGPDYPAEGFIGNPLIRACITSQAQANICFGHCFWERTLLELENGTKVMNVDSKVVILKKGKE